MTEDEGQHEVTSFERKGLGFRLWSEPIGTEFVANHIKRSSGNLECDLLIRTNMEGVKTVNGRFYQARFNLNSGPTRASLAKQLEKRAPGINIDWGILLEELCQRTIDAESAGEPISQLGEHLTKERVGGKFAIYPFVPRNVTALLYGPGGAGKSVLALTCALSIKTGFELIPGCPPGIKGNVLYLDWETDRDVIEDRVQALCAGYHLEPPHIFYRNCRRPLANDAEDLAQFIADNNIVFVVIDSAAMAMGSGREYGDANEGTLRLFEAIRFMRVSTQVIDHVAKAEKRSNGANGRDPYGSEYKTNLARSTWELRNLTQTGDEGLNIQLINAKVNDARKSEPIYLEIEWQPDHIKILPGAERDEDGEAGQRKSSDTIMAELIEFMRAAPTPLRPSEIALGTQIPAGTLGTYLRRLVERGVLVHEGVTYAISEGL